MPQSLVESRLQLPTSSYCLLTQPQVLPGPTMVIDCRWHTPPDGRLFEKRSPRKAERQRLLLPFLQIRRELPLQSAKLTFSFITFCCCP